MTKTTKIVLLVSVLSLLGVMVLVVAALVLLMSSNQSSNLSQNSNSNRVNSNRVNSNAGPTPVSSTEPIRLRLDKILEQMDRANIAFNAPGRMKLDSPSTIQLMLSPSDSIDELKKLI